ncbi:stalk domain-containing protein [Flintibacter muris]|uniref:stalk domain-containing protein n=1 Tax=Flintibacter muris TaxID=2941327 RepID=UPI00203B0DFF|nr:stalk domain-containing protein [Flintibacter muris]
MKKKTLALILTLCMTLTAVVSFTAGAAAAGGLQEIKAYLNSSITIKLDGEEKVITDANGVRTYPISYNDTTYLPVRSIANLLGVEVGWDQATQSVLLGKRPSGVDLIETYSIYHRLLGNASFGGQVTTADNRTETIGGVTKSHWIFLNCGWWEENEISYNLLGKHDTLTFSYYSSEDGYLWVKGDDDALLGKFAVTGGAVPKTVTVPLFKTNELKFGVSPTEVWGQDGTTSPKVRIFDAYLDVE